MNGPKHIQMRAKYALRVAKLLTQLARTFITEETEEEPTAPLLKVIDTVPSHCLQHRYLELPAIWNKTYFL